MASSSRPGSRGRPGMIQRASPPPSATMMPLEREGSVNVFAEVQRVGGNLAQALAAEGLQGITDKQLEEIRRLHRPSEVVRRTLEVVCLLLDCEKHPAPTAPPKWEKVQRILGADNFMQRVHGFSVEQLYAAPAVSRYCMVEYFSDKVAASARASGRQERLTYQRLLRASAATAALFRWCCLQLEVAEEKEENLAAQPAPKFKGYLVSPARYQVGDSIANNSPTMIGGPVSLFSVAPALLDGLVLNSATGVISGMPETAGNGVYVVTAAGPGGSDTFALHVEVVDGGPTLSGYTMAPATYYVAKAINENLPSLSGGSITSFHISPMLPSGLNLDAQTGVISGTPTAISKNAPYTLRVTGPGGGSFFVLSIRVDKPPLSVGCVFEVLTDSGWKEDPNLALHVEACASAGEDPDELYYEARGFDYRVDFRTMKQHNNDTGRCRPIRQK